jgi:hypoxanthine phosphoribosyltransferase
MKYDLSHTNPMSWDEFDRIASSLIDQLSTYQNKHHFKFDAVAPMLRSGGIPAVMIANKMQIIPMIPLQVKYNYDHGGVDTVIPPLCPLTLDENAVKNILVTECNTYMGTSSKLVVNLLNKKFPKADLHYACITKVYGGPQNIKGYKSYHIGCWTNEAFKDNAPNNCRPGITIYPWETAEYELEDINNA